MTYKKGFFDKLYNISENPKYSTSPNNIVYLILLNIIRCTQGDLNEHKLLDKFYPAIFNFQDETTLIK